MVDFGWSYPPGCSSVPGDEPIPPECEDCEFWAEHSACMFEKGQEDWCPLLSTVTNCDQCGKEMDEVKGAVPEKRRIGFYYRELFACSKACADEIRARIHYERFKLTNEK